MRHLFSKIRPNFWHTVSGWIHKTWWFHLTAVDFWPKILLFSSKGHCSREFYFLNIFVISSWGHEKCCQMLELIFVVFLYFINIPWMASILHATFCIFPGLIYNKKELLILVWNKTFVRVTQWTIFPDFVPNLSVTN